MPCICCVVGHTDEKHSETFEVNFGVFIGQLVTALSQSKSVGDNPELQWWGVLKAETTFCWPWPFSSRQA